MRKTIILDLGAGNNTKNNHSIIKEMIDQVYLLQHQTKKKILIKFQLFSEMKDLIPLNRDLYIFAYYYAKTLNLEVLAGIFDEKNLQFISAFLKDTPYIKIACRTSLYKYIGKIPKYVTIFVSVDSLQTRDKLKKKYPCHKLIYLYCVPEYPANYIKYESLFNGLGHSGNLNYSISDHTVNLGMYKRFEPEYYERHFLLSHEDCLDPFGSEFASTAKEIEVIL